MSGKVAVDRRVGVLNGTRVGLVSTSIFGFTWAYTLNVFGERGREAGKWLADD